MNGGQLYINGNYLQANTISANKLTITDFNNYSEAQSPEINNPFNFSIVTHTDGYKYYTTNIRDTFLSSQYIQNLYDQEYYLEIYVINQSNFTVNIGFFACESGTTNVTQYPTVGGIAAGASGWIRKTLKLASSITSIRPFLQIANSGTITGKVLFRDVCIRKKTSGKLIVDGTITANNIESNAITATKIHVDAITGKNIRGGTIGIGGSNYSNFTVDTNGNVVTAGNVTLGGTINAKGDITATNLKLNGGSISLGGQFSVTNQGALTANSATIKGKVDATSGSIGGFTIGNGKLTGTASSGYVGISGNGNDWAF